MAQDEVDIQFLAEISDPVPAVHALDTDDYVTDIGRKQLSQLIWVGWNILVEASITLLINNTDVQGSGV